VGQQTGTSGDDTLTGLAEADTLLGGAGNDLLVGDDGADTINGDAGHDTLQGGLGADTLAGGPGNDLLQAGDGNDVLQNTGGTGLDTFQGGDGDDTLTAVNLSFNGTPIFGDFSGNSYDGGAGTDYLSIGGVVNFQGSLQNIEGLNLAPAFSGVANGGNIQIAPAALTIRASDFEFATVRGTGTVRLDVDPNDNQAVDLSGLTFENGADVSFEFTGSDANDTITGTSGGDDLDGDDGDDVLTGGAGGDNFEISSGHDRITDFQRGVDEFDLSDFGFDGFASLSPYLSEVNGDTVLSVTLDGEVHTNTFVGVTGMTADDFLFPSGPVSDLAGTPNADLLPGTVGADSLPGNAGNDTLLGGAGADTLAGGLGNDLLQGGDGNDLLQNTGGTGLDTFQGGDGDDTLTAVNLSFNGSPVFGDFSGNSYDGGAGNDYLSVGGVVNFQGSLQNIEGLNLAPAFSGVVNGGNVQIAPAALTIRASDFDFSTVRGTGTVRLDVDPDDNQAVDLSGVVVENGSTVSFEFIGSDANDTITGTSGADDLDGDSGDDVLTGRGGADTFEISGGQDRITDFQKGVDKFDLSDFGFDGFPSLRQYITEANGDTVLSITLDGEVHTTTFVGVTGMTAGDFLFPSGPVDDLTGTPNADLLPGTVGPDLLLGNAGDDTLTGYAGPDTLDGGDGADNLQGGIGNDLLIGGLGADTLTSFGNNGVDTLQGGEGDDQLSVSNLVVNGNPMGGNFAGAILDGGAGVDYVGVTGQVNFQGSLEDMEGISFQPAFSTTNNGNTITAPSGILVMRASAFDFNYNGDGVTVRGTGQIALNINGADNDALDLSGVVFENGADVSTFINGSSGADTVTGSSGEDQLFTLGGNDIVDLGAGDDYVQVKTLSGETVTLTLGAGVDTVEPSTDAAGTIVVNDFTTGSGGDDLDLEGFIEARSTNYVEGDNPFVTGHLRLLQRGNDAVLQFDSNGGANSFVDLVTLKNRTTGQLTAENLDGFTPATYDPNTNDQLSGTPGADTLNGLNGNDTLQGLAGNDLLLGGEGNDLLQTSGLAGQDTLSGEGGNDTLSATNLTFNGTPLFGTFAGSVFDGGAGTDYLSVGGAVNFQGALTNVEGLILAPAFSGVVNGGNIQIAPAALTMKASAFDFTTVRGTGVIELDVDAADNQPVDLSGLAFENGANVSIDITGSDAADTITGSSQADGLDGEDGDDVLTGGAGADHFEISEGQDEITDFQLGVDKIDLSDFGFDSFASLQPHLSVVGGDTVFSLTWNGVVQRTTLTGVTGLTAGDFLLPSGGVENTGAAQADFVPGTGGADTLAGGDGADTLTGYAGNDVLNGEGGADLILAGGGDTVDGGAGADTIELDVLTGQSARVTLGSGADVIHLSATTTGAITVTDFAAGASGDRLDLEDVLDARTNWDGATNPFTSGHVRVVQDGVAGVIEIDANGGGDSWIPLIRLENTSSLQLDGINIGWTPPPLVTGGSSGDEFAWSPGSPADTVDGGDGVDVVSIAPVDAAELVGTPTIKPSQDGSAIELDVDGDGVTDLTITSVEELVFNGERVTITGDFSLTGLAPSTIHYVGSALDNLLDASGMTSVESVDAQGFGGNDTLIGGLANDLLDGGAGNDTLDGGVGTLDVARFSGAAPDYVVTDLGGGVLEVLGPDGTDRLTGIERLEFDNGVFGENVAPSGGDRSRSFAAGSPYAIAVNDFGFSDGQGDSLFAVKIVTLPATGTLKLNGVAVSAGQSVSAADIQAGLLVFTPSGVGSAEFTFKVKDDGVVGWGTNEDATANTLTLNATAGGGGGGGGGPGVITGGSNGTAGSDVVQLGATPDHFSAGEGQDTVSSGDGDDWIHGNAGDDSIAGGAGADTLLGGRDNDYLAGDDGDDQLSGDAGDDTVMGGAGNDAIYGGDGANYLRGEAGNDLVVGGSGFDYINGNTGADTVSGGLGDDWVLGGQGDDRVLGEVGNDIVNGNMGADSVSGGDGADTLRGGQGDDLVAGGAGGDWISGDLGADTLSGGAGADTFYFSAGAGQDRVTDFNVGEGDLILLDKGRTYTVSLSGGDTILDLADGDRVILAGVQLTSAANWIAGV